MDDSEDVDLDDLLSGSEDEGREEQELLGVADMVTPPQAGQTPARRSAARDIMEIDALVHFQTKESDSEEDEEVKTAKEKTRQEDVERRRAAMYELLNVAPPGINLFNNVDERGGNGFLYFSPASLGLEKDFGYSRRGKLLGHGFTSEQLDVILTDPVQLVRHLMPEAQTVLICDKNDFRAVMNFLFYSASVCSEPKVNSLLTKAFFDLRKNYGFRWSLTIKHVLTVLLNYGADEKVVYNEEILNDDKVGLVRHLEEARRSGQEVPPHYSLPSLPLVKKNQRMFVPVSPGDFTFCLSRFVTLLADFSGGLPQYQEFRHHGDWSDQLLLLYLALLLGTDMRLVSHLGATEAVSSLLHWHLDSFTPSQWQWGPCKKADNASSKAAGFNHGSVCKTLARMVNEFFPGEGGRGGVVCWQQGGRRVTDDTGDSDHHLNMVARIQLLPPSYRGTQVRKYLAYLYLQTLACIPYSLPYTVEVEDLLQNRRLYYDPEKEKEEDAKFCEGLKLIVLSKNYEMVMTLVELYDTIVGHEPLLDFTPARSVLVEKLRKGVLDWVRKKCPGLQGQRGLDEETIRKMQLAEYMDIVDGRWQTLMAK